MANIERVAAQMRAAGSLSNKKDAGRPKVACGIQGPATTDKIFRGEEAAEHAWPWMASIFIDDAWFCVGLIVSENYILAAAHCVDGGSFYDVMVGTNSFQSTESCRVEITSYNGWTHPDWNMNNLAADLALIELPEPLEFNECVAPACLPESGETLQVGSLVAILGWGKPVLRDVFELPVMSDTDCSAVYGFIAPGAACVDTSGGPGSCNVSDFS